MAFNSVLFLATPLALGIGESGDQSAADAVRAVERIELTDQNFELWRQHLSPTRDELRWQEIAWLPTFSEGVLQAHTQQKPLLLWAMNGHPLGCT